MEKILYTISRELGLYNSNKSFFEIMKKNIGIQIGIIAIIFSLWVGIYNMIPSGFIFEYSWKIVFITLSFLCILPLFVLMVLQVMDLDSAEFDEKIYFKMLYFSVQISTILIISFIITGSAFIIAFIIDDYVGGFLPAIVIGYYISQSIYYYFKQLIFKKYKFNILILKKI